MAAAKLSVSWCDSVWIPILNRNNVLEYFSQRSNPFYDRTCNNEVIRMQRGDPAQLVYVQHNCNNNNYCFIVFLILYSNMTGIEFSLLQFQEPILYVIRKAHRQSPDNGIGHYIITVHHYNYL